MAIHNIQLTDDELQLVLTCVDSMRTTMEDAGEEDTAQVYWDQLNDIVAMSEYDGIESVPCLMFDISRCKKTVSESPG